MLSPSETVIIFVLALLLFGPEQLPKMARQLGEAMRHIRSTTSQFMDEMERAADLQAMREDAGKPVETDAEWPEPMDEDFPAPRPAIDKEGPGDAGPSPGAEQKGPAEAGPIAGSGSI